MKNMKRFLYRTLLIFAGLLIFAACSEGPERDIEYTIYTTQSTLELLEGEEFQLVASPTTQTFTFETTNSAVATVSSNGLVRGVSDGACFINIISSEGLSKTVPVDVVKVIELEGIETVNKTNSSTIDELEMLIGKSTEVSTSAIPLLYNEKIPFKLIWESSDESIVTVDDNGIIKAVYYGEAEVTVFVEGKPSVKKVIPVKVLENHITGIQVESSLVLSLNNKFTVNAIRLPLDYGVKDETLLWTSSDESVVEVTDGELNPVKTGSAEITVSLKTNPAIKATIKVLVAVNPVTLNRSAWEIIDWNSCISEEPQYVGLNRIPEKMLDGLTTTFWGSKWDAPRPFPYYFIFDMKQEYNVYSISITKPNDAWRGNIKKGHVEFSTDNVTWRKVSDWSISSNTPRTHSFLQDGSTARYIRFVISDVFTYHNPNIGYASGAQCDIAEFNVLGE